MFGLSGRGKPFFRFSIPDEVLNDKMTLLSTTIRNIVKRLIKEGLTEQVGLSGHSKFRFSW